MRFLIISVAILSYCRCSLAVEEASIIKLMPGVWITDISEDGIKVQVETEYKKDNTFHAKAKLISKNAQTIDLEMEGTWTVKGSKFEVVVTKSTQPEIMKLGAMPVDEIIEITEKLRKYRNSKGKEYTEIRKKEL